jgi:prepilin-type N-terminal cleavage/methylation domain-containing protein
MPNRGRYETLLYGTGDAMKNSGQWSVVSGQWMADGNARKTLLATVSLSPYLPISPSSFQRAKAPFKRAGFTLMELMIAISIIAFLATMSLGVMSSVQEMARESATRATIAKLHAIIMKRYQSYLNRRVPVDLSTKTNGNSMTFDEMAKDRLYAIRDLMRMEMPDRPLDIICDPIQLPNSGKSITRPALSQLYKTYFSAHSSTFTNSASDKEAPMAEMLYLCVSLGSPEDMAQFSQAEIGDTDGNGWLEFLDGWGRPIFFLRWAPGFSDYSDIQKADATKYHDPFDPFRKDANAFKLIPLIYSAGPNNDPGLLNQKAYSYAGANGSMFSGGASSVFLTMGSASATVLTGKGDITNHRVGVR